MSDAALVILVSMTVAILLMQAAWWLHERPYRIRRQWTRRWWR